MTTHRQQPPPGAVDSQEYVGTREAAERLGVTERTVTRMADDGRLPVAWLTTGGHRRFAVADLELADAAT